MGGEVPRQLSLLATLTTLLALLIVYFFKELWCVEGGAASQLLNKKGTYKLK